MFSLSWLGGGGRGGREWGCERVREGFRMSSRVVWILCLGFESREFEGV